MSTPLRCAGLSGSSASRLPAPLPCAHPLACCLLLPPDAAPFTPLPGLKVVKFRSLAPESSVGGGGARMRSAAGASSSPIDLLLAPRLPESMLASTYTNLNASQANPTSSVK